MNSKHLTKHNVLLIIIGIALFLNIIILNIKPPTNKNLVILGYIILLTGVFLFIISLITLIRNDMNKVIQKGIYAFIRHPMYLGAIIMFISHIFLGQNWLVVIITIIGIICCYFIIVLDDRQNIEKFGDNYSQYVERVPRINLFLGIVRILQK